MRKLLLAGATLAFVWAGLIFAVGGIEWRVAGVLFRSRDPSRAMFLGLVLLGVQAASYHLAFARDMDRAAATLRRAGPMAAVVVALIVGGLGLRFGTFTAGGADAYGYVSQAYGWARGELPAGVPLRLTIPGPSTDGLQVPLGYIPGPHPKTMVPTYAAGLPLMMAAALVFGACGPYFVVPACGALLVWLTFLWARRAAGTAAGVIAAFLIATSPIVLYQIVVPMSDVPAGTLWTGAALAAIAGTRRGALATGLWTGAGLLVRPNLLLVAVVPIAEVMLGARGRERMVRAALVCAPLMPVVLFVGALNTMWYGAPWISGYGRASEIYSLHNILPNLARYPVWLWKSQSPWILMAFVPLLPWARRRVSGVPIRIAYLMIGAALGSYIAYIPFEAWWYLRFLLPGMGALAVLIASGIVAVAERFPSPWSRPAAFAMVGLTVMLTTGFAGAEGDITTIRAGERRYVDIGAFISRHLPDNAVVFAMQHSGSARFYGGRVTLRYDFIDPEWAPNAPADLERIGLHPYLVIDDWEKASVLEHFRLPSDAGLPWRIVARIRESGGVSIYDLAADTGNGSPTALTPGLEPLCYAPEVIVANPLKR